MYDTERIRRESPIAEVAIASGLQLRPIAGRLAGICPFHEESRPSLVVYPANQSFYCFGCGAGGDVIDFVRRLHRVGFKEAAALLSSRPVPVANPSRRFRPEASAVDERAARAVIGAAVSFYHRALRASRPALEYLRGRGITERTVRALRLGYGAPGLAAVLQSRGVDLDVARALGLLSGERERFAGRIIVPEWSGRYATWLTGRSIDSREPRYLNLRQEKPLLGLGRIDGPAVFLTEGPFDWLTAVEWGLPAVALQGTRLSRQHESQLDRFERIYLALDNDPAGRGATHELAGRLGRRAIPVELPPGTTDLNDLQRRPNGRAEFLRCLQAAAHRKETSWTVDATGFTRRAA